MTGENPSSDKGKHMPVTDVSWKDAKAFCEKLNKLCAGQLPAGYRFDLPTEAQWEYACRAGTTTALNSGKDLTSKYGECANLDDVGWYRGNSDFELHPVGKKKPNAWGLYDMHGNVWEWCLDWYGKYPSGSVTDPTGPTGPEDGSFRVCRGGSRGYFAGFCRSALRDNFAPSCRDNVYGFRLAFVPRK